MADEINTQADNGTNTQANNVSGRKKISLTGWATFPPASVLFTFLILYCIAIATPLGQGEEAIILVFYGMEILGIACVVPVLLGLTFGLYSVERIPGKRIPGKRLYVVGMLTMAFSAIGGFVLFPFGYIFLLIGWVIAMVGGASVEENLKKIKE